MSDPFDFSDFGSAGMRAAAPVGLTGPVFGGHASPPVETLSHSGFDPFGDVHAAPKQPGKPFSNATPPSQGGIHVARPPLALFAVALTLAGAGIVISALWGRALPTVALGWFLSGPMAIGVLSTFSRIDTRRRTEAVYSAPGWTGALYWLVVLVCLAGIGLGAWHLAWWAGGQ